MDLDFKKADGLVTAVIQDHKTGRILMVAYMNEESFRLTVEGRPVNDAHGNSLFPVTGYQQADPAVYGSSGLIYDGSDVLEVGTEAGVDGNSHDAALSFAVSAAASSRAACRASAHARSLMMSSGGRVRISTDNFGEATAANSKRMPVERLIDVKA